MENSYFINIVNYDLVSPLKYKDDGLGFNIKKIKTGIGLKGIVSRIEYYGGNFLIETEPNKGIHVLINLPFIL
jgi:signal transduction histidine kinase